MFFWCIKGLNVKSPFAKIDHLMSEKVQNKKKVLDEVENNFDTKHF